ncbi:hypothetical protein ACH5RR_029484 [Cinchona calisaya]|uniref:Uncharacterized protein n=1 Tax=Cinchona calisaya TaxID=153742 RepID=A0ABD2YT02_9GENT
MAFHFLSSFKFNYFMNLRSSYLSLRYEDLYVVEICSSHRFARQFGFHQDLPREHSEELPTSVLESGHPSQQPQLDEMSDETPLIQRSRHLTKKFASNERSTSTGDRDSEKC